MPRESIEQKAVRYLAEGRLQVTRVAPGRIDATCHGATTYTLGRTNAHYWCECPARVECAHIKALQHVVPPHAAVPQHPASSRT